MGPLGWRLRLKMREPEIGTSGEVHWQMTGGGETSKTRSLPLHLIEFCGSPFGSVSSRAATKTPHMSVIASDTDPAQAATAGKRKAGDKEPAWRQLTR